MLKRVYGGASAAYFLSTDRVALVSFSGPVTPHNLQPALVDIADYISESGADGVVIDLRPALVLVDPLRNIPDVKGTTVDVPGAFVVKEPDVLALRKHALRMASYGRLRGVFTSHAPAYAWVMQKLALAPPPLPRGGPQTPASG
jgi:hypothetical protein